MKLLSTFCYLVIFIFFTDSVQANDSNDKYSKIKIYFQNKAQIHELASQGLILDHPHYERISNGFSLSTVVNSEERKIIENIGFIHEILIEDVVEKYNDQEKFSLQKMNEIQNINDIKGFEFGSMGGFYTYEEILSELDSMNLLYPHLITYRDSIGNSNESRAIWAVKISDNPDMDEDEPELLYTSLHHAREPQSMMTVIYFMYYLLENYGTDPEVTYLVNNREFHFIPVINPDGFVYNIETNPNGGGMWRKNRRDNKDGSYGVDLNRNYGFEWAYDNEGSSPNPNSSTYRGTDPFSEPELQAVRDYCESHNFMLALNYHSYTNKLIYPWGYSDSHTPDSSIFLQYATEMTKYNKYVFGTGTETVGYVVNGDSDDWMYGEQISKNKIITMTPEVGNSNDGFWPSQSRIYPLAEENVYPNLLLARFAGGFVTIQSHEISEEDYGNGYLDPGETGVLILNLKNIGQSETNEIGFSISGQDSILNSIHQEDLIIPTLGSQEDFNDSIKIYISENAPVGIPVNIIIDISQNGLVQNDTIKNILLGTPNFIMEENADNLNNWLKDGEWDTTSSSFNSANLSFTDSPDGDYSGNIKNSLTLKKPVDISEDSLVFLEYWTKWSIEADWDFAEVFISPDSLNWISLKGENMVVGSGEGVQAIGQYGYHGVQSNWIKETINISDHIGRSQFWINFTLSSDEYVELDGWYIDDIVVKSYSGKLTDVNNNSFLPDEYVLEQNYPNPFNPQTLIKYQLPTDVYVSLKIYDVLGSEVKNLVSDVMKAGKHEIEFNASTLSSGIYFYRLEAGNYMAAKKLILLK